MNKTPVAIIGAGPYGLSLAANLLHRGIETRLFGRPMAFWERIARAAPARFLKSYCFGTDIPVPADVGFSEWSRARNLETFEPCAMGDFVEYGLDLQRRFIPTTTEAMLTNIRMRGTKFLLRTEAGEELLSERVIVATGLSYFETIPPELAGLPKQVLRHSHEVTDYRDYRGKHVAVIGGGQSALEAAALVQEAGGNPELIIRDQYIRWMTRLPGQRSLLAKLRSPISGLGSGPKAWILTNLPGACRWLPDGPRVNFLHRHLPPEGAWWLRSRVEGVVSTRLATVVTAAALVGEKVLLKLSADAGAPQEARYDSVIAATGFRPDVSRLSFLDGELRERLRCVDLAPRLDQNFQSSVPGLYFTGPSSAASFGPLFRFVVGAHYTTATVVAHLANGKRMAA